MKQKKPKPKTIARFVGGPMDGHSEELQEPADLIRVPDVPQLYAAHYRRDWVVKNGNYEAVYRYVGRFQVPLSP